MTTVRQAVTEDAEALQGLAEMFATSFVVRAETVARMLPALLERGDVCLLVAEEDRVIGYLLGFAHPTFYANGPVGWVEELMVESSCRRRGVGGRLVAAFEDWVLSRGGAVVAMATRRATEFYPAVGYEQSAIYYRKIL